MLAEISLQFRGQDPPVVYAQKVHQCHPL